MSEKARPPDWITKSSPADDNSMADVRANGVLYLLGATTQAEVQTFVRVNCVPDEVARLPDTMSDWQKAAGAFSELASTDKESVENGEARQIKESHQERLKEIAADPLFQGTFSQLPIDFCMVQIDNLIACQRSIDLGYVEALRDDLTGADERDLIEFCLGPRNGTTSPPYLNFAENGVVYGSNNTDFRFLGGYAKDVDDSDIAASYGGGVPAGAIVLLVGYGNRCINVFASGRRLILNNGFHRVFALREAGHTHVPAVVQRVSNPRLEFPGNVVGLPKDYLLSHPRPALLKDFFDDRLVARLATKPKQRMVKIAWGVEQFNVPLAAIAGQPAEVQATGHAVTAEP